MSYDLERKKAGREPAFFVELLLDYCSLTFGVGACPAVLGAAGKCYNTRKTCQAASAYDPQPTAYRFLQNGMGWPAGFERIASSLVSVSMSSTQLDPEGGLGIRGAVTLEFQDHPHHDRGIDKYVAERAGNAMEKGTFWGKLRARNPYYKGRVLRLWEGYLPEGVTVDTVIEHGRYRDYVIESISPPDASGRVRVVAKDVLKLADGEKAVCPPPSTGALAKPLAVDDTEIALTPGTGEEYGAAGYVQIGDETIRFTGRSGDTLTGCARAQGGTERDEYDVGETVQLVKAWDNVNVVDILEELLVDYANVPASAIDAAQWAAEKASHLTTFNLTTMITEPTPVRELLNDVLKQCLIACWQDDITGKIHLRALTPWADSVASITDDQIVAGSMSVADQPDKRVSRVRVYHGMRNFAGDADKVANFRRLYFDIDLNLEDDDEYGEVAERVFHSRWFTVTDKTGPALLASRLIGRFGQTPQQVGFTLDARHAEFKTGDVIDITSRLIQDEHGQPITTRLLILKTTPDNRGHQVAYKGFTYSPVPVPVIDIRGPKNQFNIFTHLSAPAAPLDVVVNVHPGAVVFSDDPLVAALASGALPSGSTIKVVNKGHVYGCGGRGGDGGDVMVQYDDEIGWIDFGVPPARGEDGEDAGPAIESSVPVTIDNGEGYIFGGGGGGAGGGAHRVYTGTAIGGSGGGGGQSHEDVPGGDAGFAQGVSRKAPIFSDSAGKKSKANPFKNSGTGAYSFYAPAGNYVLLLTYDDGYQEFLGGVSIPADPADAPPQNIGSGDPEEPIEAGGGERPPIHWAGSWLVP